MDNHGPTIWIDRGAFYWSTLEPHPEDPDPNVPAGPFQSRAEALDDMGDFFNVAGEDIGTVFGSVPDRFQHPADGEGMPPINPETHSDNLGD